VGATVKLDRHRQILDVLKREGSANVKSLSDLLNVSGATIRRDLTELSEQELIYRHHGGASASQLARSFVEPPIEARSRLRSHAKEAIGQVAASLIEEGETIYLSGGTTTFEVARCLVAKSRLTVITPAINIISFLANYPHITVIAPGGVLAHKHLSLVGHIAHCALKELRADRAVMGVSAIDERQGITAETLLDAETDRSVVQFTPRLMVVTDALKFGLVGAALVAPVTAIHQLVTDEEIPPNQLESLQRAGVDVRVAPLASKGVVRDS